ncbi:hypothetical protein [Pseudomonas viridiflava]|uniref:hypothetical protein n=1 Tax=Pseudomonas viridiflava TaxID=33069 RepID=UPI0013CE5A91|nr:hypothetical protein [Pseudomonas viridiflava]
MIYRMALFLSILAVGGCAALHSSKECAQNLSTEGSIITGKKFTTSFVVPGVAADRVFESLSVVLLEEGFHIETSDPKRRFLSVYQDVNYSNKRAPLNAVVDPVSEGAKVTLIFVATAGIYAPESGVSAEFCKINQSASSKF